MESLSPETMWYAIYCKSRYEKKISLELTARGIENYVPIKNEVHQWSDRKKRVEVPVLPNYIFVKTDNSQFFRILKIYGVRFFICFDRGPEPIPEKQILNFRNFLENIKAEVEVSYETFVKGDMVEITDGSMKGVVGEVVEYRGKKNLLIRLETVHCNILTDISCTKLKAVEITDAA